MTSRISRCLIKLDRVCINFVLIIMVGLLSVSCDRSEQSNSTKLKPEQASNAAPAVSAENLENNPLLAAYNDPFEIPPFDAIKTEHYRPAFDVAMRAHGKEIDSIALSSDPANFKNTIEALERSGKLLGRVSRVFFNMTSAHTNPELQALQREMSPLLSEHWDKIYLNSKLFERVDAVYKGKDNLELDSEASRLLEETYKGFRREGALLNEKEKAVLQEYNSELSKLTTQFGQNLLAETNGFELILEKSDLAGLPQSVIDAASESAKEKQTTAAETSSEDAKKYEGKYVFTPHRSSMYPFLTHSTRRDLREKLYSSYVMRGDNGNENDNKQIIAKIAQLRLKRAKLLGYDSHADYVLEERMLKTPEQVYSLLNKLWQPALARAKNEVVDMQKIVTQEGQKFDLAAWDWWHYAEKVRKAKYALDEASVKPYLTLDNVLNGAFTTANKLWGLTFTELFEFPSYHPDVRAWEVKDKNGSHLGIFLGDYFTRSSKRGGAWMSSYKRQSNMDFPQRPIVVNVCNFPAPVGDTPSLLSFDQVHTLFHEFGHALHGIVTNTRYQSLSGTSAPRDYTEFPAQIYEHWASEPQVLKTYALHYKTKKPIPDELIEKLKKAAKFNQGFANTEYLAASFLDMDWHTLKDESLQDTNAFEEKSLNKIGLIDEIAPRYRSTYFAHIFSGGYSAGYYSYIHSAVLDSDGFAAFKESGDIFDQTLAQKYRKHILETGGTQDAMLLYKAFRGREPKIDALLKVRGLDGSKD